MVFAGFIFLVQALEVKGKGVGGVLTPDFIIVVVDQEARDT